jgi:hypothetical protein
MCANDIERSARMRKLLLSIALVAMLPTIALADDAELSFGGAPRMMSGKTSVVMQSEVVTMTVGNDSVDVDCRFVFKNNGPACTVRMGFPDRGRGAADPTENEDGKSKPASTFNSFASYVDGKPVRTSVISDASNPSDLWHVKMVHFGSGQTVAVRDVYRTIVSSQVDVAPGYHGGNYSTFYVLHTGASWAGKIGRADVVVHMRRNGLHKIRLASYAAAGNPDPYKINWAKLKPGTVLWRGPSTPTLDGTTIRFARTNFEPGYLDDVLLFFNK